MPRRKQTLHRLKRPSGFTIVELLIVVVVIAILATITVVAYTNFQERARISAADSTLTQTARKLALYKAEHESFPDNLADIDIQSDDGITLDYAPSSGGYCLSASNATVSRRVSAVSQSPSTGNCDVTLSRWSYSGGVTYDGTTDQIQLSPSQSGTASSPLIPTEGKPHVRIAIETFATLPSPTFTPNSSILFGSRYFASDGTTPATNTTGHTTNGSASCNVPMSTWTTCTWAPATGPNVAWI